MADAVVIIPHYNDTVRLLRCLDALMPQMAALAGRAAVVVVDNRSTEPLDAVRAAHPGLPIVTEPQRGAAAARNRGVAETGAALLFFLDADCVPDPDWLATAFDVADRGDLVGGAITVFDETPPPRTGAQAFETVFAFDNRGYIEKQGFSVTANLLTRRDVFAAVGGFVTGVSEDLDWCHRATAAGFTLAHAGGLRVAHPTRSDWPALEKKWRRITEEGFALGDGSAASRLKWGLRGIAMPLSVVAHALRVLRCPRLRGPGERAAALITLARLRGLRGTWMVRQAILGRMRNVLR